MGLFLKDVEIGENYLLRMAGWTEERYFREAPETKFVEFEDGELIMHSPVNIRHQDLVRFLTFLLGGFVGERRLGKILNGPAVVRLRAGLDYEPDIFFVAAHQPGQFTDRYFSGAPALVVEVISAGTRNHDLKVKAAAYRDHRVAEYWIIDPEEKRVIQHALADDAAGSYRTTECRSGRLESTAIPGFWIVVNWLWSDPLPAELGCLREILSA